MYYNLNFKNAVNDRVVDIVDNDESSGCVMYCV